MDAKPLKGNYSLCAVLLETELFSFTIIAINDFGTKKYARCNWMLVLTEPAARGTSLVVS